MVFGTFDLIHAGHIHLFQEAKKYGECLIAVVARDTTVQKVKGHMPVHTEQTRKKLVESISLVDRAVLGDPQDVYRALRKIRPDVIALGYDQKVFTHDLPKKIKEYNLNTKIVRISAYQPKRYSSRKIWKKLGF